MKKSLLALATLTAFAGAASAQSSVTLFGVVDLAVGYTSGFGANKTLVTTDGNASSRLGVRGVEDLGGGLRAGFWLEGGLSADDGTPGGQTWRRRSTLSLLGNWGEVRIGRDYTPTFWNWTVFDPFGTNGFGAATNLGLETSTSTIATTGGGSFGTLVRADNTVGYHLPSMGGLYGQAMISAGEGNFGNKIYAGRLGWSSGPFNIAGSYGLTEFTPTIDLTNWNIGGSFNAGFGTFSAFYSQLETDNDSYDQSNWYIGYQMPLGAFTLKASYGSVERDRAPTGFPRGDAQQIAVGAVYDLSKRTALYATYSQIDNDGTNFRVFGGTNALGGATPSLNTANGAGTAGDPKGVQFGVRHSF